MKRKPSREIEKVVTFVMRTKQLPFYDKKDVEQYGFQSMKFK